MVCFGFGFGLIVFLFLVWFELGCFVVGFWIFWVCFCNFVVAVHFPFLLSICEKIKPTMVLLFMFPSSCSVGKGGGRRGGERRKEETGEGGGGRYGFHALL